MSTYETPDLGVTLHYAGEDGMLHPAGDQCDAGTGGTEQVDLSKVLGPQLAWRLCTRLACNQVLTKDDAHLVERLDQNIRSTPTISVSDDMIRGLRNLSISQEALRNRRGTPRGRHPAVKKLLEMLENETDQALSRLRTQEWQSKLWDLIMDLGESGGDKRYLQEADLGDARDTGMLVGDTSWVGSSLLGSILDVLRTKEVPGKVLLVGPKGALAWIAGQDDEDVQHKRLGHRLQLTDLPEDYTTELGETILGLFEPGSEGPLGDVRSATLAARGVLKET